MNKIFTSFLVVVGLASSVQAQRVFDQMNARAGESVEFCHQHVRLNEMKQHDPVAYQMMMDSKAQLASEMRQGTTQKAGVVYTIPIVFHILHNDGAENISDEQIYDAVAILNRDFRLLNSDASSVMPVFAGMPTDAEIEFKLATKAPNGTCFKGITRTKSALTVAPNGWNAGSQQLQAAFNGNGIYNGTWSKDKYLNILVARDIGGAAGYTMLPNNGGESSNSIFMLSNYIGSIGTGEANRSRALTHEIGHWLNLDHTWGGDNNPGNPNSCSQDDDVMDTPLCIGVQTCSLNSNTCNDATSSMSSWTTDVIDNVENYMDYSYCSKMFTAGQVARMRAAIVSAVGGRNKLWTTTNLNAVGAIANPPLCKADFSATKRVVCVGETVNFTDGSYNTVSGWNWTFTGATPSTSTAQNPAVTYAAPGTYEVKLVASNAGSSVTETKSAYITVLPAGSNLPYHEGFEAYTSMAATNGAIFGTSNFEITTAAANSGSKSARVVGFNLSGPATHSLTSNNINLAGQTLNNVTFSYRYAYRRKATNTQEYLKLYFSSDCGASWGTPKKVMTANSMSTAVSTTNWTPSQADFVTVHVPFNNNSYNQFLVQNFRYKFDFESNAGNNFYIDDINIYTGSASDNVITVGIEELEGVEGVTLYPNPTDGDVIIDFSVTNSQPVSFVVMDLSGKELKSTTINAVSGANQIMFDNSEFAKGVYMIILKTETSNKTMQFIKK